MANQKSTYAELISRVIRNFDEIYTSLYNKGTTLTVPNGDTNITTDQYAGLINNYLWSIDGHITPTTVSGNGGHAVIANRNGNSEASGILIDYVNKKVNLSGLLPGYFGSESVVDYNSEQVGGLFMPLCCDDFINETSLNKDGYYEYKTQNNKLIEKVTVKKGEVTVATNLTAVDNAAPRANVSQTLNAGDLSISEDTIPGGYTFTVGATGSVTGTLSSTNSITKFSKGFLLKREEIVLDNTNNTYNLGEEVTAATKTSTFYIAKGSIALAGVESDGVSIEASDTSIVSDKETGYAIEASFAKPTFTLNTTAGYVETKEGLTVTPKEWSASDTIYIKAGSVKAADPALTNVPDITPAGIGTVAETSVNSAVGYSIEVTNSTLTVAPKVTPGYVKSAESTIIPAAKRYVNIAKADVTAAVKSSLLSEVGTSGYLSTSGKAVEFKVNSTLEYKVEDGYLKDGEVKTGKTEASVGKVYIKEGAIGSLTAGLSIESVNQDKYNGTEKLDPSQIFHTSTDNLTGRDYFKITSSATHGGFSAGWIDSAAVEANSETSYYLPRAELKYIESSSDSAGMLSVEKSGFLPSGTLVDIAGITGELDVASVEVVAKSTGGIKLLTDTANKEFYTITLGKGTIDAGYISESQGALSGELHVEKGKVAVNVECKNLQVGTKGIVKDDGKASYTVNLTSESKVKANIGEGYITANDLTINDEKATNNTDTPYAHEHTITLDQAAFTVSSAAVKGLVQSNVDLEKTGKYSVTPVIRGLNDTDDAKVTLSVSKAGYIDTEYSEAPTISLAEAETVYLKTGSVKTAPVGSGKATIKTNLAEAVTGDYTISLDSAAANTIAVSGELNEGYFGSEEKALSGTATISALAGSTTIAHGKVEVKSAATNLYVEAAETGADKVAVVTTRDDSEQYYKLKVAVDALDVTTNITEGYVKETDLTETSTLSVTNSSTEFLVKKYSAATTEVIDNESGETAYVPFTNGFGANGDSALIDTADRYSTKQIKVTLHADAAGSNVRSDLDDLLKRLNGFGVSTVNV